MIHLLSRFYRNNRYISHYINYGRHEGNEFHYNNSLQTLSVSYSGKQKYKIRSVIIILVRALNIDITFPFLKS